MGEKIYSAKHHQKREALKYFKNGKENTAKLYFSNIKHNTFWILLKLAFK